MPLSMILGPMKSGKSFDLISHIAPLKYTTLPHVVYQSDRHVREARVQSRNGANLDAMIVPSIRHALGKGYMIIGVDEIHMFPPEDADVVKELLLKHVRVIVSGLDTDYKGAMFPIVQRLLSLGPAEVRYRKAVCERCKRPDATYTQVLHKNVPITGGMPSVIPDNGTYTYMAVCRHCFVTTA